MMCCPPIFCLSIHLSSTLSVENYHIVHPLDLHVPLVGFQLVLRYFKVAPKLTHSSSSCLSFLYTVFCNPTQLN